MTEVYKHCFILKMWLKFFAQIVCNYSLTPLQLAILNMHTEVSELLIKKGADVNVLDDRGNTLLHYTCKNGDGNTLKLLLKHGPADCQKKNATGYCNITKLYII